MVIKSLYNCVKKYSKGYKIIDNIYKYSLRDDYLGIENNKKELNNFVIEEKKRFNSFRNKEINNYNFEIFSNNCKNREILQSSDSKELIGDYYYYDSVYLHTDGNTYTKIYRYPKAKDSSKNISDISDCIIDTYNDLYFISDSLKKKMQIIKFIINKNDNYIGVIIDLNNNEFYTLFIKDLANNKIIPTKINKCFDAIIDDSNNCVYYLKQNNEHRPFALYKHKLFVNGSPNCTTFNDELIYEENDKGLYLSIKLSKSSDFYILTKSNRDDNKILLALSNEELNGNSFKEFSLASQKKLVFCEHIDNGLIFLLNNETYLIESYEFKKKFEALTKLNMKNIDLLSFFKPNIIYSHSKMNKLIELDVFNNHLIYYFVKAGVSFIVHYNIVTGEVIEKQLSDNGVIMPFANLSKETKAVRFSYSNVFKYNEIWEYNILENREYLVENFRFSGKSFNFNNYKISKAFAPTEDGNYIPIILVHNKKYSMTNPEHPLKLIMKVYNCYGIDNLTNFSFINYGIIIRAFKHELCTGLSAAEE